MSKRRCSTSADSPSSKRVKIEEVISEKLRLPNFTHDSCFLISLVNLLHSGDALVGEIVQDGERDHSAERMTLTSELFRLFTRETDDVADLRNLLDPEFQEGQQDVNDVFLNMSEKLPESVSDLLRFKETFATVCTRCTLIEEPKETEKICHSLYLHKDYDSLQDAWIAGHQNCSCASDGQVDPEAFVEVDANLQFPEGNKYLIVQVGHVDAENPQGLDGIHFDGFDLFGSRFVLRAAIQFMGNREAGHYVACHRVDTGGYIVLDDDRAHFERDLPPHCQGFSILLLERV